MTTEDPTAAPPDFEAALLELQGIVEKMESGQQSLEEALSSFQRGVELARACQQGLKDAEQRVEKLVRVDGELETRPLSGEESGPAD